MMSSATTIKKIRRTLLLEQAEFAQLLDVSAASIAQWEGGSRIPRFPMIRKIRDLAKKNGIEVTAEDFLDDK